MVSFRKIHHPFQCESQIRKIHKSILGEKLSRLVFNQILNEVLATTRLQVFLNELERESLYTELLHYFGLIGATNECEALENAWKDPYNRQKIEEFIRAWLKRKSRKKKPETAMIV